LTDKRLVEIYTEAKYVVMLKDDTFRLRVGFMSIEIDEQLRMYGTQSAYFITPENPFSQRICEAENKFRNERFVSVLHDKNLYYLQGYGTNEDETWPKEHSYLIFCDDAIAMHALAGNFGQKGILKIVEKKPVSLFILDHIHYREIR
jgi:hypothetical protein